MNRSRSAPRAVLLGVLLLCGCPGKKESADYVAGHNLFSHLYAEKLDDAYLDPRMANVEQLLQRVPENSLDAPAAQALLKQIQENRTRLQNEAADSAKAVAEASKPTPDVAWRTPRDQPAEDAGAPVAAPPDAGPAVPIEGMRIAEFAQRFGRCFRASEKISVEGEGEKTRWDLFDIGNCRDLYPTFVGTVILADDRYLWRILPASSIVRKPAPVSDAGAPSAQRAPAPPADDAGLQTAPAPSVPPDGSDAGTY